MVRPHALGDLLMSTPVLARLKDQGYNVRLVVNQHCAPLMQDHALVDTLVVIPAMRTGNWFRHRAIEQEIRRHLPSAAQTERLLWLRYPTSGTRLHHWANHWGALGVALQQQWAPRQHLTEWFCQQAGVPFLDALIPPVLSPQALEWAERWAGCWLLQTRASQRKKEWPLAYWQQVVDGLQRETGYPVVRVGSAPDDVPLRGVTDIQAPSIVYALALQQQALATLAPDSVFNHGSRALQRPAVVLFGATRPSQFGYAQNINLWAGQRQWPGVGGPPPAGVDDGVPPTTPGRLTDEQRHWVQQGYDSALVRTQPPQVLHYALQLLTPQTACCPATNGLDGRQPQRLLC